MTGPINNGPQANYLLEALPGQNKTLVFDSEVKAGRGKNNKSIFEETGENIINTFKGDSADEIYWKQNYTMAKALVDYYNGVMDAGENASEVYKNKIEPYEYKESSLDEDTQREAREYAIQLLKERYQADADARPDYGDCSEYYNYGSPLDWIFTHATLVVDKIAGEDSGYHKLLYEDANHGEGMLLFENLPYHMLETQKVFGEEFNEDGTRNDRWIDFLRFKTVYAVDDELTAKNEKLQELEKCIDDPEEFAKQFYLITEGKNFSPEEMVEYKTAKENDKETKSLDVILGRDYIAEDYAKNKLGTNIAFSINKTIGTVIAKRFLGSGAAFAINAGVTMVDLLTRDEKPDDDEIVNAIVTEAARSFLTGLHVFKSGILDKLFTAFRFGTTKSGLIGKGADALGDTMSDKNVNERLSDGEELTAGDFAKSAFAPGEVLKEGYNAGNSVVEDFANQNYSAAAYDSARILLGDPVAIFGFFKSIFD